MGAAMPATDSQPLTFLTTKDVMARTGMSRSTLHERRSKDPDFPKPIRFGQGSARQVQLRWIEHELEAWMRKMIEVGR